MSQPARADGAARGPRRAGSLLGGTAVLLTSRGVAGLLSLVGTVLIFHQLDVGTYGSFAFVFTLLGLLGLIADFETTRVVLVELGREGEDRLESIAGRFLVFRVGLGTLGYALAMLVVIVGPYTHTEIQGVAIGGISFFVGSALWSIISVCQAKLWLRVVGGAIVVGAAVQLGVVLALWASGYGTLLRYIGAYVASDAVALVVLLIALRGTFRLRPQVDVASWRRWIVQAAPLAVGSALATLYFRVDALMLTLRLSGETGRVAIALYQIGYKFSDLLAFLAPALMGAVLPLLTRSWPDDRARFHQVIRQAMMLVLIVAAFATTVFAVLAQPLIHTIFGSGGDAAAPSARWLVAGQALNFLTQLVYVTLVSVDRRRRYPFVTLVGLVVNVGLNWWLIPAHGVMGAAIATVVTEVVVLALLVDAVRDLPVWPLPGRAVAVIAVAVSVAGAVAHLVEPVGGWATAGLAAAVVYLGGLHILGVAGPGGLATLLHESRLVVVESPD